MGETLREGWLTKSPPEWKIWAVSWRRRWCVLRSNNLPGLCSLDYYSDQSKKRQKGSIDLELCLQVDAYLNYHSKRSPESYDWIFDLRLPKRTYFLAADSEADMNAWVADLCFVCKLQKEDGEVTFGDGLDIPQQQQNLSRTMLPANNSHHEVLSAHCASNDDLLRFPRDRRNSDGQSGAHRTRAQTGPGVKSSTVGRNCNLSIRPPLNIGPSGVLAPPELPPRKPSHLLHAANSPSSVPISAVSSSLPPKSPLRSLPSIPSPPGGTVASSPSVEGYDRLHDFHSPPQRPLNKSNPSDCLAKTSWQAVPAATAAPYERLNESRSAGLDDCQNNDNNSDSNSIASSNNVSSSGSVSDTIRDGRHNSHSVSNTLPKRSRGKMSPQPRTISNNSLLDAVIPPARIETNFNYYAKASLDCSFSNVIVDPSASATESKCGVGAVADETRRFFPSLQTNQSSLVIKHPNEQSPTVKFGRECDNTPNQSADATFSASPTSFLHETTSAHTVIVGSSECVSNAAVFASDIVDAVTNGHRYLSMEKKTQLYEQLYVPLSADNAACSDSFNRGKAVSTASAFLVADSPGLDDCRQTSQTSPLMSPAIVATPPRSPYLEQRQSVMPPTIDRNTKPPKPSQRRTTSSSSETSCLEQQPRLPIVKKRPMLQPTLSFVRKDRGEGREIPKTPLSAALRDSEEDDDEYCNAKPTMHYDSSSGEENAQKSIPFASSSDLRKNNHYSFEAMNNGNHDEKLQYLDINLQRTEAPRTPEFSRLTSAKHQPNPSVSLPVTTPVGRFNHDAGLIDALAKKVEYKQIDPMMTKALQTVKVNQEIGYRAGGSPVSTLTRRPH